MPRDHSRCRARPWRAARGHGKRTDPWPARVRASLAPLPVLVAVWLGALPPTPPIPDHLMPPGLLHQTSMGEVQQEQALFAVTGGYIFSFQPIRTSHALTGHAVKKPRTMESCISIQ